MIQSEHRQQSCSESNRLSSSQNRETQEDVSRELLTYLGHLPNRLHKNDLEAAELALMLGNALVWIAHKLDCGKPQVETALGENPRTIYALGKQFQAVARPLMYQEKQTPRDSELQNQAVWKALQMLLEQVKALETGVRSLSDTVETQTQEYLSLENIVRNNISLLCHKKGGVK